MGSTLEVNGIELDPRAQNVAAVCANEGQLTTSDVRDVLDSTNSIANHRMKKLCKAGLAEMRTPEKKARKAVESEGSRTHTGRETVG